VEIKKNHANFSREEIVGLETIVATAMILAQAEPTVPLVGAAVVLEGTAADLVEQIATLEGTAADLEADSDQIRHLGGHGAKPIVAHCCRVKLKYKDFIKCDCPVSNTFVICFLCC